MFRVEREGHHKPFADAPRLNWTGEAKKFASALTPGRADELCRAIGLPRLALDSLPLIGYDAEKKCWTFPERDHSGRIIGIVQRFRNGRKISMSGSRRGLTIPARWRERDTPIVIVEGASDTLALSLCGISCVGRPSNTGGSEFLAALLAGFDREIVVLGENDRKESGLWPGRDGAIHVATRLVSMLRRRVAWALPPPGIKDARDWVLSRNLDPTILDGFHDFGDSIWG